MSVLDAIGKAVQGVFGGGRDDRAAAGGKPVSAAQAAQFAGLMSGSAATGGGLSEALAPTGIFRATGTANVAEAGSAQSPSALQSPLASPTEEVSATSKSPLAPASDRKGPQEAARVQDEERQAVEEKRDMRERADASRQQKDERTAEQRSEASERTREDARIQDRRVREGDVQAQRAEIAWRLHQQLHDPSTGVRR